MKTISEVMQEICNCIRATPGSQKAHSLEKAVSVFSGHKRIAFSISGGSDSDTILNLWELLNPYLWGTPEVYFVFFDTGLEFEAAKRHLDYLEWRYGITIDREKPRKTIPAVCREYGVPFISKDASDHINRLQRHGLDWSDPSETATTEKYGDCKSSLDWYYCRRPKKEDGTSNFEISQYKLLREFIIANPPSFSISEKCCDFARKFPAEDYNKKHDIDLVVTGMRKAEGGRRVGSIKGCFSFGNGEVNKFNPILYWSDADKAVYKEWRNIRYSDCYEIYGLKRTGCVGCPFNSRAEQELKKAEPYEPLLVKAARNIFAKSYEYKRQYIEFKNGKKG